jgi:hypothetical protein
MTLILHVPISNSNPKLCSCLQSVPIYKNLMLVATCQLYSHQEVRYDQMTACVYTKVGAEDGFFPCLVKIGGSTAACYFKELIN